MQHPSNPESKSPRAEHAKTEPPYGAFTFGPCQPPEGTGPRPSELLRLRAHPREPRGELRRRHVLRQRCLRGLRRGSEGWAKHHWLPDWVRTKAASCRSAAKPLHLPWLVLSAHFLPHQSYMLPRFAMTVDHFREAAALPR